MRNEKPADNLDEAENDEEPVLYDDEDVVDVVVAAQAQVDKAKVAKVAEAKVAEAKVAEAKAAEAKDNSKILANQWLKTTAWNINQSLKGRGFHRCWAGTCLNETN